MRIAYFKTNWEQVIKEGRKLWPKIRNCKRENEREMKLNCFTYYVDALMRVPNISEAIHSAIMEQGMKLHLDWILT
jgi:hypothetical protein